MALVMGPGFAPLRAAARMLCVSTGAALIAATSFFAGAVLAAGASATLCSPYGCYTYGAGRHELAPLEPPFHAFTLAHPEKAEVRRG